MKLFCFGMGYTAKKLCKSLSTEKWHFSGTNRKSGDFIFNGNEPMHNAQSVLKDVTHLLISIAPSKENGDLVLLHHQKDILNMPSLKWVGYLSATSVYGDHSGNWVDETSETKPVGARGLERKKAEQQWENLGFRLHIFRLSGIYGPERNQVNAIKEQTIQKIIKEGHSFSRIHVEDIVSALMLSMNNPIPGIYNLADDQPSSTADIIDYVCEQLNMEKPKGVPFEEADLSEMRRSFYQDHKKVSNKKLKQIYNWKPKYSDYKAGYDSFLK